MGVHYLSRHNEQSNARLPLKITFNADPFLETDSFFFEDYRQMANGKLKSIGIDGSVFIHSHIVADRKSEDDNDECFFNVYMNKSANEISTKIAQYVETVLHFFQLFENEDEATDDAILVHIVIDGKPPAPKNRKKKDQQDSPYSQMDEKDKKELHRKIMAILKEKITKEMSKIFGKDLILLSNETDTNRGEGELRLFSLCQKINEKYNDNKNVIRNVIVSPDSDVIAMMALHGDKNLVIVCPTQLGVFITNHSQMLKGLKLKTSDEFMRYVALHFIFFGSDYNAGLMTNPTESKQLVLYNAVKRCCDNLNEIGRECSRKQTTNVKERLQSLENPPLYLKMLKEDLIAEAVYAMMYYYSSGENIQYVQDHISPSVYRQKERLKYIPLIPF